MSIFQIDWIERNTTRAQWLTMYRIIRKHADRGPIVEESRLSERVAVAAEISRYTEGGQICVVTSGMDCDCCQYCNSRLVEGITTMGFISDRDNDYAWADGPINVGLCRPSDRPEARSRDLVMEAFEDGHPHIVFPGGEA